MMMERVTFTTSNEAATTVGQYQCKWYLFIMALALEKSEACASVGNGDTNYSFITHALGNRIVADNLLNIM